MNLVCTLCGAKGTKATMLTSRHSANVFCIDGNACQARQILAKLPVRA